MDQNFIQECATPIIRLAHFELNCKDEYGHQILDYLVLDCLAGYGIMLTVDIRDLKYNIKTTLKLEFEEAEIYQSAKRLAKKGHLHIIEPSTTKENARLQLYSKTEAQISTNLQETKSLETKVYEDWRQELLLKYKHIKVINTDVQKVIGAFKKFLTKLLFRHGVESVAVLYPEAQKTHGWLTKVKSSIINDLPDLDSETNALLQIEVPAFFESQDKARKKYLNSLFNSSFFWHLIQIDEKCSNLIRDNVIKGQTLILDNNILYSLIGLDGPNLFESTHQLLRLARQLGYQLIVTTKTIDEFNESLQRHAKHYKQHFPLPTALAEVAIKVLREDHFMTQYWKSFVENGISMEEFVTEKSHIQHILDGLNIGTINKFRKEIEESEELIDEMSLLRTSCNLINLNDHIVEHDAFHKILVSKLRKGVKYKFSEANFWFLTHDSKLPFYGRASLKGKNSLSFCITTSQWIQINRPLLTRTNNPQEYEDSFHNLVKQPFLRAILANFSSDEVKVKLFNRMSRYNNMSPELAFGIATDNHFVKMINQEDEDPIIEKKIENYLITQTERLKSELQAEKEMQLSQGVQLKSTIKSKEVKIEELQRIIKFMQVDHHELTDRVEELASNLKNRNGQVYTLDTEKGKLKHQIDEAEKRAKLAEERVGQLQKEREDQQYEKWRNQAYYLYIPGILVGLAIIFFSFCYQDLSFNYLAKTLNSLDKYNSQARLEIAKILFEGTIVGSIFYSFQQIKRRLFTKKC